MKKIVKKTVVKKAQTGVRIDKTATKKPTIRKEMQDQPDYRYLEAFKNPTKEDSAQYKQGFGEGRRGRSPGLFRPLAAHAGGMEGKATKKVFKKPAMKHGGNLKKKK